jgi:hypothetical protein
MNDTQILVEPLELPTSDIFVYGQEVHDFKILNKNAIYTLTVAAVQGIDRQLQQEKQKVNELQYQNSLLQESISLLEQNVYNIEKRLSANGL